MTGELRRLVADVSPGNGLRLIPLHMAGFYKAKWSEVCACVFLCVCVYVFVGGWFCGLCAF